VYQLAREHKEFWQAADVFTATARARMLDAQLVSELLVLQIAGQQDKKGSLDSYYARFDESWPDHEENLLRFRATIDCIRSSVGEVLKDSVFRRPPYFYTLFAVVYHHLFGLSQRLPDGESPLPESQRSPLTDEEATRLADALLALTEVLADKSIGAHEELGAFREASARQTDNVRPRLVRFRALWNLARM
jgi:hypothetical protein